MWRFFMGQHHSGFIGDAPLGVLFLTPVHFLLGVADRSDDI